MFLIACGLDFQTTYVQVVGRNETKPKQHALQHHLPRQQVLLSSSKQSTSQNRQRWYKRNPLRQEINADEAFSPYATKLQWTLAFSLQNNKKTHEKNKSSFVVASLLLYYSEWFWFHNLSWIFRLSRVLIEVQIFSDIWRAVTPFIQQTCAIHHSNL